VHLSYKYSLNLYRNGRELCKYRYDFYKLSASDNLYAQVECNVISAL